MKTGIVFFGAAPRKPDPSSPKGNIGFTLVELLVVIAIVGVLVALIFPTLRGSLTGAKRAKLISNMRGIAAGVHSYASENNGRLPAYFGDASSASWWEIVVAPYINQYERDQIYSSDSGVILRSIFHDPSDNTVTIPAYGSRPTRNIAMNGQQKNPGDLASYPGGSGATYRALASVAQASKLLLLSPGCTASASTEFGGGSCVAPNIVRQYSATNFSRGQKTIPVTYADGHAEMVSTNFYQQEAVKDHSSQFFDPNASNPGP